MLVTCLLPLLCLVPSGCSELRSRGWLDRLVGHHKKNFLEDLARVPSPITVSVEPAPPGFVDSPLWDWAAVERLLALAARLEPAAPARLALRRALAPVRRMYLPPGKNTYQLFPSLSKFIGNNFDYDMVHYDASTVDETVFNGTPNDTVVVYISNPIEARLPGSRITVKRLREIMETRAKALREMPTTTDTPFNWIFKSTGSKSQAPTSEAETPDATDASSADPTTPASAASTDEVEANTTSSDSDAFSSDSPKEQNPING